MRVLHVVSGKLYGGVETMLVTLARRSDLCPQMEPEFALCFEGRLRAELEAARAPVHSLGEVRIRYPLSVMRARKRLQDVIAQRRIDVVVCHLSWAQAIFGPAVRTMGRSLVFLKVLKARASIS